LDAPPPSSPGEPQIAATGPSAAAESSGLAARLSTAATILGAFFALGQTGSQFIHGYYQHQIELSKAQQDLILDKQKSDSALASEFLKLILDKDTDDRKRSLLLDALSSIPSHPLQSWAKLQYTTYEAKLDALDRARRDQLSAYDEKNEAERKVHLLEGQIASISATIEIYREDPDRTEKLHVQRTKLREQLAFAKGNFSVVERKTALANSPETADKAAITFSLPIDRIRAVLRFPHGSAGFDKYMPFIASGLSEFGLTDKKMVAAIVATAAWETDFFSITTELGSGRMYEGRKELGNTIQGDGERYRGRGLIQIVGRANYARYSERLGLGTLLIDSPEEANEPDVAARTLCAYFKDREAQFVEALSNSDLQKVRKLVSGGSNGVAGFSKLYADVLAVL
jgi:peptidoglycan L-alanyl-D-glutamate endopeptidase CwlK